MTTIFCSDKVSKFLNISQLEETGNSTNKIGSWNCHMFYLQRKKSLIFVNKQSLYSLVIIDFSKSEFANIHNLLYSSMVIQLTADGLFTPERAELCRQHFTKLQFSTTDNDRPVIGSMNDFIYQFKALYESGNPSAKAYQKGIIATFLNETPMGKVKFETPIERLDNIFVKNAV